MQYAREMLFMPGIETRTAQPVVIFLTEPFQLTP